MSDVLTVTGANGFVGSRIYQCALEAGLSVCASDRQPTCRVPCAEYVQADVLRPETLVSALAGANTVIHAAGLAHVFDRRSVSTALFHAVNVLGTRNVARAAAETGVRRLVLVSSVSVYGPHGDGVLNESTTCQPDQPYPVSKYESELEARTVCESAGIGLTILRMATIYGEGDPGNVARLIRAIDRRRFIWVGNGANRKSLLHRNDAARACIAAVMAPAPGVRVYNVSAPVCSMRDIVEAIARALARSVPPVGVPATLATAIVRIACAIPVVSERAIAIDRSLRTWLRDDAYDAARIETKLGFRTGVSLEDGIRGEVEWYRQWLS